MVSYVLKKNKQIMEKIIVAFATDDKQNLTKEHFGEAKEYLVYEISKTDAVLIKTVPNRSPEEKMHGDPNKAKGVAHLLKPLKVQVLVNKAFGRNITRMQQKFVCILSQKNNIQEEIKIIQSQFNSVVEEWQKGEERNYLKI